MNRIQGFQTKTEEGIKIVSANEESDVSIYIGENFSIISHTNNTTTINSNMINL